MFVHGPEIREEALRLVAAGVNDCEVARRLGIARTTVRDWRRPRYFAHLVSVPAVRRSAPPSSASSDPDYAELLGLYLGDGNISQLARTQSLRISLDARYP